MERRLQAYQGCTRFDPTQQIQIIYSNKNFEFAVCAYSPFSNNLYLQTTAPTLGLFTSVRTILCCALPALLLTLGMGAALVWVIFAVPWITAILDYKTYLSVGAGIMLALSQPFCKGGDIMPHVRLIRQKQKPVND